jgi:phage gp46-like protein
MTDRFQGDPKLILDENGADLVFKGGQPVMDQGLENAALISLHTREGWYGNIFARTEAEKIGSKYETELEQPITLKMLASVRNAAIGALNWMISTKLAAEVNAETSNPAGTQLMTVVSITPPSRDAIVLQSQKHGANWLAQKAEPAYLRI